jgi:FkbM family methyltransferase
MYTLKKIGLVIKRYFPGQYKIIRSWFSPLYFNWKAKKASGFNKRTTTSVSCEGYTFSIVVDPANGFVDKEIFSAGVYEPDILSVIKKHLSPDSVYVDIGANIGQHTLFAAFHLNPKGKVIAFEPIPQLVTQIQESIKLNSFTNITLHQVACSNKADVVILWKNPSNIGGSGFHHADASLESIVVKTTPADKILMSEPKIDFIKIDTEGHELEVLQGLQETIKRHKPTLLVEYSPSFWGTERLEKSNQFFAILNQHSYTCYDLEAGHAKITDTKDWLTNFDKLQTNLLCLPPKN